MKVEYRNEWIVSNIEHITKLIKDFCTRHTEMDFEELYSEVLEALIKYLDTHEHLHDGYFLSNESDKRTNVWQWILNECMKFKRKKDSTRGIEEPHYCFELLYLKDLDLGFVTDYIYSTAVQILTPTELAVFFMKAEWDCTFAEIADTLGFNSRDSARRYYLRARRKLYWKRELRNQLRDFSELYFGGIL